MLHRLILHSAVVRSVAFCAVVAGVAGAAIAETDTGRFQAFALDTGLLQNTADTSRIVYEREIHVADAPWLRLSFENVILGRGSALRIISREDGAVQDLDAVALQQWNNTSAYFNGDAVLLQLIAGPHTMANTVRISEVLVGSLPIGERNVCGGVDDRVPSSDPAVARMLTPTLNGGCTGTIFATGGCMATAGHCIGNTVIQFNVPPSSALGGLRHPGPEDQYMTDTSTVNFTNIGIGADWGVFECFPNTQTGLTTYQAQGAFYPFAAALPSLPADIYFYGYGSASSTLNQTQQLSTGPIVMLSGSVIQHQADAEGGSSGSAILNVATNEIIGVHTHGGCTGLPGVNSGTTIANGLFVAAIAAADCDVAIIDGDFDFDGDVDLSDFSQFSLCFGGPNNPPAGSCPVGVDADFDDDGDVDLGDFAEFSLNFTGPL